MARVTNGKISHARQKKVLKLAKGYRGRSKNCYRIAKQSVDKALQYSYRDRRKRKSSFRSLWIQRINAASREHGMTYSQFMNGIHKAGIEVDRKVLADIAVKNADSFKQLVKCASDAIK